MENVEEVKELKKYIHQFILNLDCYLFDIDGPSETIISFLSHYGYQWSAFIMKDIVSTGVFSPEELAVLAQIEALMVEFFDKHYGQESGWSHLEKEEYLKLKSISYDYLKLVYNFKNTPC